MLGTDASGNSPDAFTLTGRPVVAHHHRLSEALVTKSAEESFILMVFFDLCGSRVANVCEWQEREREEGGKE